MCGISLAQACSHRCLLWTALLSPSLIDSFFLLQEAELYGRKASEALASQLGAPDAASRSAAATAAATDSLTLDAGLAAALLEAPLLALQQWGGGGGGGVPTASSAAAAGQLPAPPPLPALDVCRYRADFEALLRQELPFFRDAGACGHCGAVEGPGALTDRAWLDFLSYIQFKALGRQLGAALAPRQPATLSGWERMVGADFFLSQQCRARVARCCCCEGQGGGRARIHPAPGTPRPLPLPRPVSPPATAARGQS